MLSVVLDNVSKRILVNNSSIENKNHGGKDTFPHPP